MFNTYNMKRRFTLERTFEAIKLHLFCRKEGFTKFRAIAEHSW